MSLLRRAITFLLATVMGAAVFAAPLSAHALSAADFIAKTYAWAQSEERTYGVPASVAMAQSMLESGMGESGLTTKANNWFGIKCSSTASPHQNGCYSVQTTEYDANGNPYTTTAKFRKYDTPELSFIDHGRFLSSSSRYAKAFSHTNNPDRFIYEVHMGGYATDPLYANKVINLMERHNLYQYNLTPPASGASQLVIRPATRANVGAAANVTGLLSPGGGGRSVWTQVMTASGWSTSQKATTGSRGQFSLSLTYGANSVGVQRYRVQAASAQGTLTSAEFTVDRLGTIRVDSVTPVLVGQTARLRGTATGYAGRTITAESLSGGSWKAHATGTVAADGSFDLPLTLGNSAGGTWSVRAALTTGSGAKITSSQVKAQWTYPVSLVASAVGSKLAGQDTNTWGTATGAPNAEVWTEVQVAGRWSRSQVGTTDSTGWFVLPLTYGAHQVGVTTWRVGLRTPAQVVYSNEFTLQRTAAPVNVRAYSAGTKPVGQVTNTWGTAAGAPGATVWTEVRLASGWSRSQVRTTDASGYFVIPLTYGANQVGAARWRVGVSTPAGVFHSPEFDLRRTR